MVNKKVILGISIVINIFLGIICFFFLVQAYGKLQFEFAVQDTITPDSLRMYLDRENYGVAASLSRPIRGGAEVAEEDLDYYRLGEYADVLFLKEIYRKTGQQAMLERLENEASGIRSEMPDYGVIFDKIDLSIENALSAKNKKETGS